MEKPGYRTSELWVVVATVLAGILNKKLGLELDPMELASLCGTVAAYVAARGWTKSKRVAS